MIPLYWLWLTFAVCTGLVLGSFANVAISRWAVDRSVVTPGSHCPTCGTSLGPIDLVPVLSWVWLRARCRHCATPIAPTYPLIEALMGLLSLLIYWRTVPSPAALTPANLAAWAVLTVFVLLLIIAAYVDLRHWIIPDQTSIYAIPFGIVAAAGLTWLGYDGWMAHTWKDAAVGALCGSGMLASASIAARYVYGFEALGWGDVKLMGFIGAFTGPLPVMLFVLLVGCLFGIVAGVLYIVIKRRRGMLPFGPSLVIAAVLYVLYGDVLTKVMFPTLAMTLGW